MTKDSDVHPRWVLRRDGRSAGRYSGNKVVRWIARPTLIKGRFDGAAATAELDGAASAREWARPSGYGMLRIVSDK